MFYQSKLTLGLGSNHWSNKKNTRLECAHAFIQFTYTNEPNRAKVGQLDRANEVLPVSKPQNVPDIYIYIYVLIYIHIYIYRSL